MDTKPSRTRTASAVIAGLVAMAAAACTPSPESSTSTESCAPTGTAIGDVTVRIIDAPPGSTLTVEQMWHLNPGGGPTEDAGSFTQALGGLQADQIRVLPDNFRPYPDRCLHFFPDPGVRYQVTMVAADPATQLLFALGYRPEPAILGFPRGTLPPSI
jgi:hypothetical protein